MLPIDALQVAKFSTIYIYVEHSINNQQQVVYKISTCVEKIMFVRPTFILQLPNLFISMH